MKTNSFLFPGSVAEAMANPETAPIPTPEQGMEYVIMPIIEYINSHPDGVEAVAIYSKRLTLFQRMRLVPELVNLSGHTNDEATLAALHGSASLEVVREASIHISKLSHSRPAV